MVRKYMTCPNCKEEIDNVLYSYKKETSGTFYPEDETYDDDYDVDNAEYTYYCPCCDFEFGNNVFDILDKFKEKEDIERVIENVKKIGGKDGTA